MDSALMENKQPTHLTYLFIPILTSFNWLLMCRYERKLINIAKNEQTIEVSDNINTICRASFKLVSNPIL